jgi:large subunit ribosomal protein L19e
VDHVFAILTGQNIRKLVKDGFIIKKPQKIHSRSRARRAHEAKQKGRHSGYGMLLQLIYVTVFKDGSTCANLMSL